MDSLDPSDGVVPSQPKDFKARESAVLAWLLAQPAVAAVADAAADEDRKALARPILLQVLQKLLGDDDDASSLRTVTAADAKEGAKLVLRRQASELSLWSAQSEDATPAPRGLKRLRRDSGSSDDYWLQRSCQALETRLKERSERKQASQEKLELEASRPLYWMVDLPCVSALLEQKGFLPADLLPVERPHVTLLYLAQEDGGDARLAQSLGVSVQQLQARRSQLEALEGTSVQLRMTEVVIEANIACAKVALPSSVPFLGGVPHVTLATRLGTPPRFANQVLEDVQAGRREGITRIQLPRPRALAGTVQLQQASPVVAVAAA